MGFSSNSGNQRADDKSDKIFPYQGPFSGSKSNRSRSPISGADSFRKAPSYPAQAILRQDSVTIQREMA